MKYFELDAALMSSISPKKIAMYLEYKKWRKEKEAAGIASLWSYIKNNKKISVLLPLDSDLSDFEIKIEELVTVLSRLEERPLSELLKVLESTSLVAKRSHREVIDLKIESLEKNEVPAREIGEVLKSMQDLFVSIGTFKSITLNKNAKEALRFESSELKLSLLDTFQGSFGIRVGLPVSKQLNLFDDSIAEESVETFMRLIIVSTDDNSNALKSELETFQGELLIKFQNFIKCLIKLESDLVLEWGSVNPQKGGIVSFPLDKIMQAFEIASQVELGSPYDLLKSDRS